MPSDPTTPDPSQREAPLPACPICGSDVTEEQGFADNFSSGPYFYASCQECTYQADIADHRRLSASAPVAPNGVTKIDKDVASRIYALMCNGAANEAYGIAAEHRTIAPVAPAGGYGDIERAAVSVALTLLAEAMDDGNEHLFAEMSTEQVRDLAERFQR